MQYKIIIIPLISAFIGYLTNVVAIKLLFWPQRPISLAGFQLQGLLPKRKADIAVNIGELVEKELFSLNDVIDKLNTPQVHQKMAARICATARDRLDRAMPRIIPDRFTKIMSDGLEKIMRQEIPRLVDQVLESEREFISREIQVKKIIQEKINNYDLFQLEKTIRKASSPELRFIEILGGVLGLIIGLVQVGILFLFSW